MPWWIALLIAVTATAVGYGIDAGHKELTHVFAGCYIAGCVLAVLAVQQQGLFTAIIQPPLILFCAVPGAYWLFHEGKIGHLKDLLINCGYPLIERFPLMLGTAGVVLLIGLVRWYFGMSQRATPAAGTPEAATPAAHSILGPLAARLHSFLRPESDEEFDEESDEEDAAEAYPAMPRRGRAAGTTSRARRTARTDRATPDAGRTRSRRAHQPLDDPQGPTGERPRRPRRKGPAPARDYDTAEPPRRPRRRARPQADPDPRDQSPREARGEPRPRGGRYERSAARNSRFDGYDGGYDRGYDRYDPPGAPDRNSRYDAHERYEPGYEARRRRTASGANPTHHPISQVRYRGAPPADGSRADPHDEYRPRSRASGRSRGRSQAESWEYDV